MAELTINGHNVTIDDSFLKLSPEQQNQTVDHIAKQLGAAKQSSAANDFVPPPAPAGEIIHQGNGIDIVTGTDRGSGNPYAATRDTSSITTPEQDRAQQLNDQALLARSQGADTGALGPVMQGNSLGWGDEAVSGMNAGIAALKGNSPANAYDFAQDVQRQSLAQERADHPTRSAITEGVASIPTIAALSGVGASSTGLIPASLSGLAGFGAESAAMGTDGAILGGIQGAGAASDTNGNRIDNGIHSGMVGFGIGAAMPAVSKLVGALGGNQLMSALMPESSAAAKMADVMRRSGMTSEEIQQALEQAATDGQNGFMVADATGNAGQRALAGVARQPSDARQALIEALDQRQAGQGRRLQGFLSDAFEAPDSAAAREASLTAARDTAADTAYGAARSAANPVDVSGAIAQADQRLSPGISGIMQNGGDLPADSISGAVARARALLTNGNANIVDFNAALDAKQEIDDMISRAVRAGDNNRARVLTGIKSELDDALAVASSPYAAARDQFAQGSKVIEAVGKGKDAAMRGRIEDTLPAFYKLSPQEQVAFRAGYTDPYIADIQKSAIGVNKARPLMTDATSAEFPSFAAPGKADQLGRQIGRENTMFDTRTAATGGSRTAENLADMADTHNLDPGILTDIAHGHFGRAAIGIGSHVMNFTAGRSGGVRDRLIEALMISDPKAFGQYAERAQSVAQTDQARKAMLINLLTTQGTKAEAANSRR